MSTPLQDQSIQNHRASRAIGARVGALCTIAILGIFGVFIGARAAAGGTSETEAVSAQRSAALEAISAGGPPPATGPTSVR